MKTLAILTNGGDTCALNASIKSIRDNAYRAGYRKIYGVRRGYQGLLDGAIDDITGREIDVTKGGSFLGSMRSSPTKHVIGADGKSKYIIDEAKCNTMAERLKEYRVDVLVVIGGDGTLQSTKMFQEWVLQNSSKRKFRRFELMGFLKTIDNDIRTYTNFGGVEVALCPGFPSAAQKIACCVQDLRVTAQTAERAFSVEMMGRDAGWLAAAATFGGAEILLVPETLERAKDHSKVINELVDEIVFFYEKNRNVLVAVGEGFEPKVGVKGMEEFSRIIKDLYGPRKHVGATERVTLMVSPILNFYFACHAHLVAARRAGLDMDYEFSKLTDRKATTPKELGEIRTKYFEAIRFPGNPLRDWDVGKNLKRLLSVGQCGTADGNPPYKFEIRPHRTDYLPRSGPPSAYDYRFATVLGEKLGDMLLNKEFGAVPALKEVVEYEDLKKEIIKSVPISDIETLNFSKDDYFVPNRSPGGHDSTEGDESTGGDESPGARFQVSDRITNLFRMITTGPTDLHEAIHAVEELFRKKYPRSLC